MPSILICAGGALPDELRSTILWREGHVHHVAPTADQALRQAFAVHPDLILIDRDLGGALRLLEDLRRNPGTRDTSIAITAHGEISDLELQLLQNGANAVIRLPAGPESDERLSSLMRVPGRRAARVPVRLELLSGVPGTAHRQWGAVLNISETGMLVEVESPLPVGADIELRFSLEGTDGPILCSAQVVREAAPGCYGVHFHRLERAGLLRIRGFVAAGSTTERRLPGERPARSTA